MLKEVLSDSCANKNIPMLLQFTDIMQVTVRDIKSYPDLFLVLVDNTGGPKSGPITRSY